jgi:hypothetical protein
MPVPKPSPPPKPLRSTESRSTDTSFAAERAMRTCPICSAELHERKCKLYCPRPGCGYFLSCADFY